MACAMLAFAVMISIEFSAGESASNPRYFKDGCGKAVYLTAAYTWANLQDVGLTDLPPSLTTIAI
jgi:hypothetical protein